jgi:hypothetical protein
MTLKIKVRSICADRSLWYTWKAVTQSRQTEIDKKSAYGILLFACIWMLWQRGRQYKRKPSNQIFGYVTTFYPENKWTTRTQEKLKLTKKWVYTILVTDVLWWWAVWSSKITIR